MADQATEGLLSPYLKRQRIAVALPYLKGRILDVGCGNGALARHVDPDDYTGIDIDETSIIAAKSNHSRHTFLQARQLADLTFDTVVALAVIEHVSDPCGFLTDLKSNLKRDPEARVVCTTPHPSMDWIHWTGARIGLFSPSANEEHEELLGRERLEEVGRMASLKMVDYRRFLFGANQVCVYAHNDI